MRDYVEVKRKAIVSDQLVAPLHGPVQRSPSEGAATDVLSATLTVTVPIVLPEDRPLRADPPLRSRSKDLKKSGTLPQEPTNTRHSVPGSKRRVTRHFLYVSPCDLAPVKPFSHLDWHQATRKRMQTGISTLLPLIA